MRLNLKLMGSHSNLINQDLQFLLEKVGQRVTFTTLSMQGVSTSSCWEHILNTTGLVPDSLISFLFLV